jgi:hypothetical protein
MWLWPVVTLIYVLSGEPHNTFWNVVGVVFWVFWGGIIALALFGRFTRRHGTGLQPHEKCYVCTHVFDGDRVLYVTRPDGDWCFLCGVDHPDDAQSYFVVGTGHVLAADGSLAEILDLGPNQEAERSGLGRTWTRSSFAETANRE